MSDPEKERRLGWPEGFLALLAAGFLAALLAKLGGCDHHAGRPARSARQAAARRAVVELERELNQAVAEASARPKPEMTLVEKGVARAAAVGVPGTVKLSWDYGEPITNHVRFEIWSTTNLMAVTNLAGLGTDGWTWRTNTHYHEVRLPALEGAEYFIARTVVYPWDQVWWTNGLYSDWAGK